MGRLNDMRKFIDETNELINKKIAESGERKTLHEISSLSSELGRKSRMAAHYNSIIEKVRFEMVKNAYIK